MDSMRSSEVQVSVPGSTAENLWSPTMEPAPASLDVLGLVWCPRYRRGSGRLGVGLL